MTNVDDGTKRAAKEGRNHGSNAVGNHGLANREGIPSLLGTDEAHERRSRCTDPNRNDDTEVVLDEVEIGKEIVPTPDGSPPLNQLGGILDLFLLVETRNPAKYNTNENDHDSFGDAIAPKAKLDTGVPSQIRPHDGIESDNRRRNTVRQLLEPQKGNPDARNRHQERRRRYDLENGPSKDTQKAGNQSCNEIGRERDLVSNQKGLVHGAGFEIDHVEKDSVENVEDKGKGRGCVEAVGLGRVGAAVLIGESNGLPGIIQIANDECDTDTGHNATKDNAVNERSGDSKVGHVLNGEEGSEEGGEIVEKELAGGAHVAARHGEAILEGDEFLWEAADGM